MVRVMSASYLSTPEPPPGVVPALRPESPQAAISSSGRASSSARRTPVKSTSMFVSSQMGAGPFCDGRGGGHYTRRRLGPQAARVG